MYTDFYNLREKPFNLTPSSRFLYLGEVHKEALALLTYGVVERKGFILLTGEVGTGKTTMVHALLDSLDNSVQCVYLSNPLLSPKDFIKHVAHSTLKKNVRFKTRGEVLMEFEAFLKQCLKHQKNFVLIIDEAQKLSYELLEEIRLLSNMETGDDKLVNIFLVGQPELNEILNEQRCRPLLQRISIRYHIKPLDLKASQEYILTRLKKAGAEDGLKIFSKDVIKAIHQYSDGYPRMMNILADNILLLGYSMGKRKIAPMMVEECYRDIQLDSGLSKVGTQRGEISGEVEKATEPLTKYRIWVIGFILIAIMTFMIGITAIFLKIQQQKVDGAINELKNEIKTFQSDMERYQRQMVETIKRGQEVRDINDDPVLTNQERTD